MEQDIRYRSRIFHVERLRVATSTGAEVEKDVVRHPGSVAILPLLGDGQVCLIRNYRVSVAESLLEVPAGTMEPPEPPEKCAYRELIEETGYRATSIVPLASFPASPWNPRREDAPFFGDRAHCRRTSTGSWRANREPDCRSVRCFGDDSIWRDLRCQNDVGTIALFQQSKSRMTT